MEKGRRDTVLLTVIAIATLLVAIVGATFAFFTARVTGQNSTSTLTITSSRGGTITFTGGSFITVNNIYPRSESWVEKPFMVQYNNPNGNYETRYKLWLVYTNTFGYGTDTTGDNHAGEIKYELVQTNGYCTTTKIAANEAACNGGTWTADTTSTDSGTRIGHEEGYLETTTTAIEEPLGTAADGDTAIFTANASVNPTGVATSQTHTYRLTISYPDTGVNQNYENRASGTNQEKSLTAYIKIEEVANKDNN